MDISNPLTAFKIKNILKYIYDQSEEPDNNVYLIPIFKSIIKYGGTILGEVPCELNLSRLEMQDYSDLLMKIVKKSIDTNEQWGNITSFSDNDITIMKKTLSKIHKLTEEILKRDSFKI